MSEEILVKQGAPTLAGIKTGSLFPCPCRDESALLDDIRRLNRLLAPKGLCLLPIRFQDEQALLYLYRPAVLHRDLQNRLARRILSDAGYPADGGCGRCVTQLIRRFREGGQFPHEVGLFLYRPARLRRDLADGGAQALLRQSGYGCESCGRCIAQLIRRLQAGGEFPHEVGLFLSYPPEDVQGFIDHRACDFKCAGLWKVYGDEQQAQRLFSRFKHCTEDYCARWQTGWDIDRLAVSTRRTGTQPISDTFRRPGLCGGGKCGTMAAMS